MVRFFEQVHDSLQACGDAFGIGDQARGVFDHAADCGMIERVQPFARTIDAIMRAYW